MLSRVIGLPNYKEAKPLIEKLYSYLEEEGRNSNEFGIDIRVNLSKHPRDTWAKIVEQWQKLGVTYIGV